jgi:hypothetical protein
MVDTLRHFHTYKDVSSLGGAIKMAFAKGNALRMELMKRLNVDKETNAKTWMPS